MLRARHSRNSYYLVGAGSTKEDGVVVQYQSDNTTEHMTHGQPQLQYIVPLPARQTRYCCVKCICRGIMTGISDYPLVQ